MPHNTFYSAVSLLLSVATVSAREQGCPGEWLPGEGAPGINGFVTTQTTWDPDGEGPEPALVIVAGSFDVAGNVAAKNIAAWDGETWHSFASGLNDVVYALTVFEGQLVAGGIFTSAGGAAAPGVARWNGSAWSTFADKGGSRVFALTVFNGELIASGIQEGAFEGSKARVARWDGVTWQAMGQTFDGNGLVDNLITFNGELIGAGGDFSGIPASPAYKWNGTTWENLGVFPGGSIDQFCVYNGELFAAGLHVTTGTPAQYSCLARWNGSVWTLINPTTEIAQAWSLVVSEGKLVVGGLKTTFPVSPPSPVATWDGTKWESLGVDALEHVFSLTELNGELFAAGSLHSRSPVSRAIISRKNSQWRALGTGITGPLQAVASENGHIYIAGGQLPDVRVYQSSDSGWQVLGGAFDLSVLTIASHQNQPVIGGQFRTIDGVLNQGVLRWDGANWTPMGSQIIRPAFALRTVHGEFYAGGAFIAPPTLKYIARWDGLSWAPVGEWFNGPVRAICEFNEELVAAGDFTASGSTTVNRVARWDGASWHALGSGNQIGLASGSVNALEVFGGELIAGGTFTKSGTQTVNRVARWNGSSWTPLASGLPINVKSLASYKGRLIAAGEFPTSGSTDSRAYRWDGNSWESIGANTSGIILGLVRHGDDLIAVGSFGEFEGIVSASIARWRSCELCSSDFTSDWVVDDMDFVQFVLAYNLLDCSAMSMPSGCPADLNADGLVDDADFGIFVAAYNLLTCP